MNLDELLLALKVVIPVLKDAGGLVENVLAGSRQYLTASAELRNILVTALDRLDAADKDFDARDSVETARVRALIAEHDSK